VAEAIRPRIYELESDIKAKRIDTSFEEKYDVIAVRVEIKVLNRWPEDNRGDRFVLEPGVVLHRKWQGFTKKEKETFASLSEEELRDLKASSQFKKIQVTEVIRDLGAGLRQSFRHIPRQLNYLKEDAEKKEIVKGEAVALANLVEKADRVSLIFIRPEKFGPKAIQRAINQIGFLRLRLERATNAYKREATQHWGLAQKLVREGKRTEAALEVAKANLKLAQRRAQISAEINSSLEHGEKRMNLYLRLSNEIERVYDQLTELIIRTQKAKDLKDRGRTPSPEEVLSIGKEGSEIRLRLKAICPFKPFYERVESEEVRALDYLLKHAQAGKIDTMLNSFKKARAKLEVLVKGEIPAEEEIRELEEIRL
jgi:hypothetical protein